MNKNELPKEVRTMDLKFEVEEVRSENEEETSKMKIRGYSAVFNQPETYSYTEVIAPTAFDEADMSDVVLRYNHNDTFMVLARTRNNSLKLDVDGIGLMMEAELQEDISSHRDIYNAIKSGLIDKQSFAFTVAEDDYDYDTDTRTIKKIGKVFDVSVVDQPFYNGTNVAIARDINNDEFLARRAELRKAHEEKLRKEALQKAKDELLKKLG